jgi:hypothetical protein
MIKLFILSLFSMLVFTRAGAQIMSTVAGTGTDGYTGDGGPATAAQIGAMVAAVDAAGNVYISDEPRHVVRKISAATGIITTVAGNGTGGFSGDGGPATLAQLHDPRGIAVDAAGNLYICDLTNHRIRKVNVTGTISTFAGNGAAFYGGDGVPANTAPMHPYSVATDGAGNVYIADNSSNRIRKVNTAGIISTVAGTGTSGFAGDNGPATAAQVSINFISVDAPGNIYVTAISGGIIRKINTAGIIRKWAGTSALGFSGDGGPATAAKLSGACATFSDGAGNVYISDNHNNRIRMVNGAGIINTVAGTGVPGFAGDGGAPLAAWFNSPGNGGVDAAGNIYISDASNYRIRLIGIDLNAPFFTGGHAQYLSMCKNAAATPINTLLRALDLDAGQRQEWAMVMPPAHGTAVVSYTVTSTGAPLLPTGLTYMPAAGYRGQDSFKVSVADAVFADTTTIYVTVIPFPDAGFITGTDSVCAGAAVTYTNGVPGGVWSASNATAAVGSGTGIVVGMTMGTDTIRYIVTTGCGPGSDTATKTIRIDSIPTAGVITGIDSVCVGVTLTLSDTVASGVWSSSNTAIAIVGTSGVVVGLIAGTAIISYSVTSIYGCTGTAWIPLKIKSYAACHVKTPFPTAIGTERRVTVFPNPVRDELTLSADADAYQSFTITNSMGQQFIKRQPLDGTQTTIDVRVLPAGMYYISFRGEYWVRLEKFVKR